MTRYAYLQAARKASYDAAKRTQPAVVEAYEARANALRNVK